MTTKTRKWIAAVKRMAPRLVAGGALAVSATAGAQEPPVRPATPAPSTGSETVPSGTGETTTQQTTQSADPERFRLQREQEERDSETVVRQRASDDADAGDERTVAQRVDDARTTAAVKSRLLIEDATQGLKIDVSTFDHVVTLRGEVRSDEERRLAEQIARNVEEVRRVQNELQVVNAAEQPQ